MKVSITFFIRTFNDLDHMYPIIYTLIKSGTNANFFVCYYNDNLDSTPIGKEIAKNTIINVRYVNPLKLPYNSNSFLINKIKSIFKKMNIIFLHSNLEKLYKEIYLKHDKNIVVFDRYYGKVLLYLKKKWKDAIFISVPHGSMTNINRMIYISQLSRLEKKEENKILLLYDEIIYNDFLELEINEIKSEKISVLGSIRYSDEWLSVLNNLIPKNKINTRKIKCVFFLKKYDQNVFVEELERTILFLSQYHEIDFIIKPHTRGMNLGAYDYTNVFIDYQSTSTELIEIADFVLFYGGTSIVFEALMKKKVVACIDYLDANRNVYEYFDACFVLKCRDELKIFLNKILKRDLEPIDSAELLKEMVYARNQEDLISERYVSFFTRIIDKSFFEK